MKGVLFGDYHTWGDFQLIMTEKDISAPEPNTHYVEIAHRNFNIKSVSKFKATN